LEKVSVGAFCVEEEIVVCTSLDDGERRKEIEIDGWRSRWS